MGPRYCCWYNEEGIIKPEGGWAPVHVEAICRVWTLRCPDVRVNRILPRVYFALVEVAQRRKSTNRRSRLGPSEICRLTGLADTTRNHGWIRRAVARLTEAELIAYRDGQLRIRTTFTQGSASSMTQAIKRSARRVPVPRRMLRRLAASGRADMATLLAVLIRCVHNHHQVIRRAGRLQVAWVAKVFKLSRSAVITAKKRLITEQIIVEQDTPQWEQNKPGWGVRTLVNLAWSNATNERESAQKTAPPRTTSERPCLHHHLSSLRKKKNQHPGRDRHRPDGVLKSKDRTVHTPTASKIVPHDLKDIGRLQTLFTQLTGRKGGRGDRDFLAHVALAVRARQRGRNAPAFFAWSLKAVDRARTWITEDEEEEARQWILREKGGLNRAAGAESNTPPRAVVTATNRSWSDEERFVIACKTIARRSRGDGFSIARRAKGWTRSRWDAACLKYEQKRLSGITATT